jgi:glycosyltransferase involved in cell wall biosynthesis
MGIASKYSPIVWMMRILEKKLYRKADAIIFTAEGGYDYILERNWGKLIPQNKVYHINNGVDLEAYQRNILDGAVEDSDLDDQERFKVVYAGSIRQANGLDELIDSAIVLQNLHKAIFLIYGDGDYKENLQKRVEENSLQNVVFKGKVDKKSIPYILSKSDLNLLNYNAAAAAAGFYRFGSSQNKLFEYFASGKPIIANFKANYDLISRYQCGISKNILDAEQYAEMIQEVVDMDLNTYYSMCENALKAAADYDFKILTDKLISIIESV